MNDLDLLRDDIIELSSKVDLLEHRVGEPPYFLVVWIGTKREYIGIFYTNQNVRDFINSCRLKNSDKFKKKSPLGKVDRYSIERSYIPEHIPIEPTFEG